jgi:hypothetical protein
MAKSATSDSITTAVKILTAIVGVAIVAVLVSKQADTANVLGSAGKSFAGIIGAAVAPVTGGSMGTGSSTANLGGYFDQFGLK